MHTKILLNTRYNIYIVLGINLNKLILILGNVFPDQHEVRSIVSVNGKTVTLNESLLYNHWGLGYERAEVG